MKYLTLIIVIILITACSLQANDKKNNIQTVSFKPEISANDSLELMTFYNSFKTDNSSSKVNGTVSKGSLENGKLVPYFGENFTYFDKDSYLGKRAFTSDKVLNIILSAYSTLQQEFPGRHFFLMELSNQNGGKMFPHRTHQNGLSVDFMMPKLRNNAPYYNLDTIGKDHYWLDFNDKGEYSIDKSVKIDFELIARHILLLDETARKKGYKVKKVIIKVEYKDELLAGRSGQVLKKSGIYIVKNLTTIINNLHDDHFHVDFEKL